MKEALEITKVKLYEKRHLRRHLLVHSQLTFTCSKSTIETLEKGVKFVPS